MFVVLDLTRSHSVGAKGRGLHYHLGLTVIRQDKPQYGGYLRVSRPVNEQLLSVVGKVIFIGLKEPRFGNHRLTRCIGSLRGNTGLLTMTVISNSLCFGIYFLNVCTFKPAIASNETSLTLVATKQISVIKRLKKKISLIEGGENKSFDIPVRCQKVCNKCDEVQNLGYWLKRKMSLAEVVAINGRYAGCFSGCGSSLEALKS
ncbi:hypothetical protein NPIL_412661 [Nephila pilipes]|uniref:Uncharacterized protein n=1 Tax=Nephila pilipes TaxID=299642 RepID=A0A8X6TU92_NEPPI|nr:hypothetical protein NPIL_412661 [Nephila pilipes]